MVLDKEEAKILSQLCADVHDTRVHMNVLNREGGELRDEQKRMNLAIEELKERHAETKTNIDWLMKMTWFMATTSFLTLSGMVVQFLMKK